MSKSRSKRTASVDEVADALVRLDDPGYRTACFMHGKAVLRNQPYFSTMIANLLIEMLPQYCYLKGLSQRAPNQARSTSFPYDKYLSPVYTPADQQCASAFHYGFRGGHMTNAGYALVLAHVNLLINVHPFIGEHAENAMNSRRASFNPVQAMATFMVARNIDGISLEGDWPVEAVRLWAYAGPILSTVVDALPKIKLQYYRNEDQARITATSDLLT